MEIIDDKIRAVLRRAWSLWGSTKQWNMVIEECAELISAINRYHRKRTDLVHLVEEVADATIMLAQAREALGPEVVDTLIRLKLARLTQRVEAGEEKRKRGEETHG
jgi:NTP pyrophosphatase (non-canonical NTP hydrolase)